METPRESHEIPTQGLGNPCGSVVSATESSQEPTLTPKHSFDGLEKA